MIIARGFTRLHTQTMLSSEMAVETFAESVLSYEINLVLHGGAVICVLRSVL